MGIIGRERELRTLARLEASGKPEFVAVYGRRRVGKTFLITSYFQNKFTFTATGASDSSMKKQLKNFFLSLKNHFNIDIDSIPSDWFIAFNLLRQCLERDITPGRKVIFIDEMPWLDTPKSGFISALEYFWNSYASRQSNILLIVCGSSASWIIKKLINNYGGLYNRVTCSIIVEPFNLYECEQFYRSSGIALTRRQIAEAYMILGGIPFYMDQMDKMHGLQQNIDMLLFDSNAKLKNEFERLYHSLFRISDNHIKIAEALSKHICGISRKQVSEESGVPEGGGLTKVLDELEACGLICRNYDYKRKKGGETYKLIDFFTIFHFKFISGKKTDDSHFWTNFLSYPAHRTWCGYAFERLCMAHIKQIKHKLGISGVITESYAFHSLQRPGAQIDIIIDRKDDTINLCECKYAIDPYVMTAQDSMNMERKKSVFLQETGTKKAIHMTMITASGLVLNAYSNDIQAEIVLDDLFMP